MYVQRVDGDAWIEPYRIDDEPGPVSFLVMGRLGGDEFILSGPWDTPEQAHQAEVRLRLWALARMTG